MTANFYDWEVRGRGWLTFEKPVVLEPPFRPFFHRASNAPSARVDDGRRHTLISWAVEGVASLFRPEPEQAKAPPAQDEPEPQPDLDPAPAVEFRFSAPRLAARKPGVFEALLTGFSSLSYPVSFEVIGTEDEIAFAMACRSADCRAFVEIIRAYLPEATIRECPGGLARHWHEIGTRYRILHVGLAEEFMLPLRTRAALGVDPLVGVLAALGDLEADELGVLQVLFTPARQPWAPSILRAVDGGDGPFFVDFPELLPAAKFKVAEPLFAVVIRVAGASNDSARAAEIAERLADALHPLGDPRGNVLAPLNDEHYPAAEFENDLIGRRSHRTGCLLNASELAALVHLPGPEVSHPKLKSEAPRTKAAPATSHASGILLGENEHQGEVTPVSLSVDERLRHMHLIGASGTGKSTLLLNLICQDIEAGHGIAVLDPHGDLIDDILACIPTERIDDVILFDPSDEAYPVGFNILEAHSETEKNLLASDLGAAFRRLATSWGDQMTAVLGNAILAVLESSRGGTLQTLRRLLADERYREAFLETVSDPEVVFFFRSAFPLLPGKPQGPILTRLDTFLRPKIVRYIVSQRDTRLDFGAIMDHGTIFLAKLAQGAIGEENAHLLGALLVSKFQQLAIARQQQEKAARRPFFCYVDEFHNFITPSMAAILSGARKYKLGLVLAHQEMRQLHGMPEVQSSVIANPYVRVCFRLGDDDARKLADGFSFFSAEDLVSLEVGEAIVRLGSARQDFSLRTLPTPPSPPNADERRDAVIERSRARFARPREEVEAMLAEERPEVSLPRARRSAGPVASPDSHERKAPSAPSSAPSAPEPLPPKEVASVVPLERSEAPSALGRGGARHKYLQQLIKQLAEQRGFRAVIEEPAGEGRVDVALRRGELAIACEISVSTGHEHELGNIEKCLASGYAAVLVLREDRRQLEALRKRLAPTIKGEVASRVLFLGPEDVVPYLDSLPIDPMVSERTVRGYRVTVSHKAASAADAANARGRVARVIARSLHDLDRSSTSRS